MKIVNDIKVLCKFTLKITDSQKRFPKKYRFTFVNRMQDICLDLYNDIEYYIEIRDMSERLSTIDKMISNLKTLIFMIELSLEKNFIDNNQCEKWIRICSTILKMMGGLKKSLLTKQ